MLLTDKEILHLINEHDMVKNYIDLDVQVQPNGFDFTIDEIYGIDYEKNKRELWFDKKVLPEIETISFGNMLNQTYLEKGVYKFKINETIKLPPNVGMITVQRSSFMRMGNITNVGFWDCGYHGSGYSIMIINFPTWIHKNARIIQGYFFETNDIPDGIYNGSYQRENVEIPKGENILDIIKEYNKQHEKVNIC